MKFTKESVEKLKNRIKRDDGFQKSNIENLDEKISEFVDEILNSYLFGYYNYLDFNLDVDCMEMQIYDQLSKNNYFEIVFIDLDMIWIKWMNKFSKYF